jgi:hypothetical protein
VANFAASLDPAKALWPALVAAVRNAARGAEEDVYAALLPLVATLPPRLTFSSAACAPATAWWSSCCWPSASM